MIALKTATFVLGCAIAADYVQTPTDLEVRYEFRNTNSRPVLVFNRQHRMRDGEGHPLIDPNLASIVVIDDAVIIAKRLMSVPEGMFVESRNIPCATLVRPNETYSETFKVSLPLTPWSPYSDPGEPRRGIPDLYLELGFFIPSQPGLDRLMGATPSLCPAAFDERDQQILRIALHPRPK